MKRLILALCLTASAALAEGEVPDAEMAAAVTAAQSTLMTFLQNVVDPRGIAPPSAGLNVAVQTGDAAHPVENIWVSPFVFLPDGKVAGLAVHAGTWAKEVQADKTLTFTRDQIVDWSWRPGDGKVWGEYTTRAHFAAKGLDAKENLGAEFSPTPLPPEWN